MKTDNKNIKQVTKGGLAEKNTPAKTFIDIRVNKREKA